MPLEDAQGFTGRHILQSGSLVSTTGEQITTIRREGNSIYEALMTSEFAHQRSVGNLPQPGNMVIAARGNKLPIRRKGDCTKPLILLTREDLHLIASHNIPKASRICSSRKHIFAIRRKGHTRHVSAVARESVHRLASGDIPDAGSQIFAAGGDNEFAIRGEGSIINAASVPGEDLHG